MSNIEVAQMLGSGIIALIALGIFWIASGKHWMCLYGRAALINVALYLVVTVGVRLLVVPFGALEQEQGRAVNGLTPVPFLLIMVQLIVMHTLTTRDEIQEARGNR